MGYGAEDGREEVKGRDRRRAVSESHGGFDNLRQYVTERRPIFVPNKKQTSKRVATVASKVLQDDRFSDKAKSAAGSALSQARGKKKGRKK